MTQNKLVRPLLLAVGMPLLYVVGVSPEAPLGLTLVRDAHAIVGAPLTPVSVAGVARRTAYRSVAYGSTATATTSATAQQQSATAQKQAAAAVQVPAGTVAVGTVVNTLPAGCAPETKGGVEYQRCGSNYYRAAFQGNNLVYVVQQP